jgi:hypothetical protein
MNKIRLPFLVVVLSINCAIAEAADWTLLGKNNLGAAYYDKYSIEKLSGDVMRVWVKNVYSSEGVKAFREAFPQIDSFETISYTLYIYELKCSTGSFRSIKATTYNSLESAIKGTDLDYIKTGQATWEHITPNSMMALLSEASCKYPFYDRQ